MTTSETLLRAQALAEVRASRYAKRKFTNIVALVLSLMAMAFGLFWLFWILFETVRLGTWPG
jgi:phosphate transport system permease protein